MAIEIGKIIAHCCSWKRQEWRVYWDWLCSTGGSVLEARLSYLHGYIELVSLEII